MKSFEEEWGDRTILQRKEALKENGNSLKLAVESYENLKAKGLVDHLVVGMKSGRVRGVSRDDSWWRNNSE